MSWRDEYRAKLTSPEKAIQVVQSGQRVALGTVSAEPQTLVEALVADRERLRDVELFVQVAGSTCPYAQRGMENHFRVVAVFPTAALREYMRSGHAEFLPTHLSEVPRLLYEGRVPLDVAFISVSPPDRDGFCSYGSSVDLNKSMAETAKVVVAEINDRMPRTLGDSFVPIGRFDHIIESTRPVLQSPFGEPDEVATAIGHQVASVIEDRDCLEVGIGSLPNAVLAALGDRKDLGVHTGVMGEGVMDLVAAGVITGRYKQIDRGKIVAASALGSQRFYDFLDNNTQVEMHPVSYTHNARVLGQLANFVAINSAFQVDLSGQVNAESIGGVQTSGIGGSLDFTRAAWHSPGGRAIVALPSTASGGTVSRIVPRLAEGVPATTPRADIEYVATEYGIVDLRGKTLRQRGEALASIAHPEFRDSLLRLL